MVKKTLRNVLNIFTGKFKKTGKSLKLRAGVLILAAGTTSCAPIVAGIAGGYLVNKLNSQEQNKIDPFPTPAYINGEEVTCYQTSSFEGACFSKENGKMLGKSFYWNGSGGLINMGVEPLSHQ